MKRNLPMLLTRQRDLLRLLEPADGLAPSPIRHASVNEARLDVSMAEVVLYEVDRLAGVEKMGRHRMTQPSLSADEKSRVVVGSGPEVALENRHERPEQLLLSRVTVLHPPDPDRAPLEVDVFPLEQQTFGKGPELLAADRGFWSRENKRRAKEAGVRKVYIPLPHGVRGAD
jgi:hypothetical protein